jgi:hypothetical protein
MKATRSLSWAWLLVRKERIFLGMYEDGAHGGEAGRFWPLLERMWDGVKDEEGAAAEPALLSFAWLRRSRADSKERPRGIGDGAACGRPSDARGDDVWRMPVTCEKAACGEYQ